MGYKAYILVSLVDIPEHLKLLKYEDLWKVLTKDYFPKFKIVYDELKTLSLLTGPETYISSGGASKILNVFDEEITLFTSKFPEFTFGVYFFYYDLLCLKYWTVKNDKILNTYNYDIIDLDYFSGLTQIGIRFNIKMRLDDIEISNNITQYINDKYKNPYDVNFDFKI